MGTTSEDTVQVEFYSVWPDLGKKFNKQLGEIRTDTASLQPVVRGVGLDAAGDFSTLDGVAANSVQAYEIGKQDFHNKFRTHYNKDNDLFEIAYNNGTTTVPTWYTTWWINDDGHVTQQNTPTTASNVGSGEGLFKQKVGVDLEFKSITATSPITIVNDGNTIDVDGSALVSTYSSLGGDVNLVSTKVANDLPFKDLTAGASTVLTDNGTSIRIDSTAQVVEFYGIHVGHDDGTHSYNEVHNFLVNRRDFYVTQQTTNPSNKTIILNSISDPFNSDLFVSVAGDDMTGPLGQADGTASLPSYTFTDDTSMGVTRLAANDLGVSIAGAAHTRFLSDRLFLAQQLQVTTSGGASSPDIFFFPDSNSGIYQQGLDSVAFATGGLRAGWFSQNQDFYVTNRIVTGKGALLSPAWSFGASENMGAYWVSNDSFAFATRGVKRFQIATSQVIVDVPLRSSAQSTSASNVAYAVTSTSNGGLGMYEGTTLYGASNEELAFAANDALRFSIGDGQLTTETFIRTTLAGTAANPLIAHNTYQGTGIYFPTTNELGFATGASGVGVQAARIDTNQKWWFANDLDVSSGDILADVVTVDDETYGAGWNADLSVPTKNSVYDKIEAITHGRSKNTFYTITVIDKASIGHVAAGTGLFYARDGDGLALNVKGGGVSLTGVAEDGYALDIENGDVRIITGQNLTMSDHVNTSNTGQIFGAKGHTNWPGFSFIGDVNTGLSQGSGEAGTVRMTSTATLIQHWTQTYSEMNQPLYLDIGGNAATPDLDFRTGSAGSPNTTGLYLDNGLNVTVNATRAAHFTTGQNLTIYGGNIGDANDDINVVNDLTSGRVHSGVGLFYIDLEVEGNTEVSGTVLSDRVVAEHGTFYSSLESPEGWNQIIWAFLRDETSLGWSSKPAALTQALNHGTRDPGQLDLSYMKQWRLCMRVANANTTTGSVMGVLFSSDGGSTWRGIDNGTAATMSTVAASDESTGWIKTDWTNLHADAKADVLVNVYGEGGDGADASTFGNIDVQFRG